MVSIDGYSYLVRRKVAMMSGTLRNMLNNDFAEAASNTCPVNERCVLHRLRTSSVLLNYTVNRGIVVEKLCEYLQYKHTYENAPVKEDVPEFTERIPPEVALELCVAPYSV